jgi:glyoxylase-like metal-dependent hydrolase (beta-lactamase superfamily II)
MKVQHFFDPRTGTLSYVCFFKDGGECLIVDSVWDFDLSSGRLWLESFAGLKSFISSHGLRPILNIETHVHADHLTAAEFIRRTWPGVPTLIGARIAEVQRHFKKVLGYGDDFKTDGSQFELHAKDGDTLTLGPFTIRATAAPGHTSVCTIYQIDDALFVGDVIFMPDQGTGRCDFPGGDAKALYKSVHERLYSMPSDLRVFTGHDYQPGGRDLRFQTTVADEKEGNVHLRRATTESEFLSFRRARDATLDVPKLLYPSLQVNMNAGRLREPFLRIPVTGGPVNESATS